MTILFDATKPVKTPRTRLFGLGLTCPRPERLPFGPSASDRAWAAYELNKDCRDYDVVATAEDRRLDALAEESALMDRTERGIRPF